MFSESKGFQVIQHFDDRNKIIPPCAARKILLMEILHQLILFIRFYTSQVVQEFFQQYHRTPFCWCFFVPLGHAIPQVKKYSASQGMKTKSSMIHGCGAPSWIYSSISKLNLRP